MGWGMPSHPESGRETGRPWACHTMPKKYGLKFTVLLGSRSSAGHASQGARLHAPRRSFFVEKQVKSSNSRGRIGRSLHNARRHTPPSQPKSHEFRRRLGKAVLAGKRTLRSPRTKVFGCRLPKNTLITAILFALPFAATNCLKMFAEKLCQAAHW